MILMLVRLIFNEGVARVYDYRSIYQNAISSRLLPTVIMIGEHVTKTVACP